MMPTQHRINQVVNRLPDGTAEVKNELAQAAFAPSDNGWVITKLVGKIEDIYIPNTGLFHVREMNFTGEAFPIWNEGDFHLLWKIIEGLQHLKDIEKARRIIKIEDNIAIVLTGMLSYDIYQFDNASMWLLGSLCIEYIFNDTKYATSKDLPLDNKRLNECLSRHNVILKRN